MSRLFTFLAMFTVSAVAVCSAAKADVVTWKDPLSGVSVTYPDTWERINNQKPDDVLTIAAPQDAYSRERTQCRIRVREDRRFAVYPAKFARNIQNAYVSRDFWMDYAAEFQDTRIDAMHDGAQLGRGFASKAQMTFEPDNQKATGFRLTKRAMVYASQYEENLYIFECSTQEVSYEKWYPIFSSIVKTVDFRQSTAQKPHGEYHRDFLKDKKLKLHGLTPIDHYYY